MTTQIDLPRPYGECEYMRLYNETETANPLTAAVDIVRGFRMTFKCYANMEGTSGPHSLIFASPLKFFSDLIFFSAINHRDILIVFMLSLLWTLGRHVLVSKVYFPLANYLGVLPKNLDKFSESAWKSTACFLMWSSACYVTFFRGYDFFENPLQQYADWTLHNAPLDLSVIYAIEASFYFHSMYATLFMDAWRKDSVAMLMHHLVALTLISFSYAVSCLKIGLLIFVLDDINDVLLELGKCATYLRNRRTGYSLFFDVISNIMATMFAVLWMVLRLYLHLTKVWRSGSIGIWTSHPVLPLPFHMFMSGFLGSLYAFYLYWFYFIVLFIGRVLSTRQSGSIEDPREAALSSAKKKLPEENKDCHFKSVENRKER